MLVWIDLEMTGLEVDKDKILEIATLITSETLEKLRKLSLSFYIAPNRTWS